MSLTDSEIAGKIGFGYDQFEQEEFMDYFSGIQKKKQTVNKKNQGHTPKKLPVSVIKPLIRSRREHMSNPDIHLMILTFIFLVVIIIVQAYHARLLSKTVKKIIKTLNEK